MPERIQRKRSRGWRYAPAVWEFSHGAVACGCGFRNLGAQYGSRGCDPVVGVFIDISGTRLGEAVARIVVARRHRLYAAPDSGPHRQEGQ